MNNLPADVARAIGAGVVIAVGLDTSETDGGNNNLLSAVRRSPGIMVSANEKHNVKNLGRPTGGVGRATRQRTGGGGQHDNLSTRQGKGAALPPSALSTHGITPPSP